MTNPQTDNTHGHTLRNRVTAAGLLGVLLSPALFQIRSSREQDLVEAEFKADAHDRALLIEGEPGAHMGTLTSIEAF